MVRLIPALITVAIIVAVALQAAEAQTQTATLSHPSAPLLLTRAELTAEQIDPLQERIELSFGKRGRGMTIGQAMREILQPTGWRLAPPSASNAPAAMLTLLNRPLARVHCELGVCRVEQSLEAMIWPCFALARDYVAGTLWFDLAPAPSRYRCPTTPTATPTATATATTSGVPTPARSSTPRLAFHGIRRNSR